MTTWLTSGQLTALLGALAAVITAAVALVGAFKAKSAATTAKTAANGNAADIASLQETVTSHLGNGGHSGQSGP